MRQLAELAKNELAPPQAHGATAARQHETRSVRFNDACRTMTAQLPAESYAEVRAGLEARARQFPSDGETRYDQRLADALGLRRPRPCTTEHQDQGRAVAEPVRRGGARAARHARR